MNRLLFVTIILALFSPGVHAQNYNPKFDQGLDLAEFLNAAAEEPSLQTCMPLPSIEGEAVNTTAIKNSLLESLRKEFPNPKAACFGCPYGVRVTTS